MNNKHIFWQALLVTILIFVIGFIFGFFFENSRADEIEDVLLNSEINLLDEQIRTRVIDDFNVSCIEAKESLFDFADRVYWEALKLDNIGESMQLIDDFYLLHKRYDLLRTLIWLESSEIKERCGEDFHTLVYLYEYNSDDVDVRARQVFFSRLLLKVKEKHPSEVLLVPIAVNTEISSLDLIISEYDIDEFPVIIVDDRVVDEIVELDEFEKIIDLGF